MWSYKATWRLGLFKGMFNDMTGTHEQLMRLVKVHELTGTVFRSGWSFIFDLEGSEKNVRGFADSLDRIAKG